MDNIELVISESTNNYVTKINLNTMPMYTKKFLVENNAVDIFKYIRVGLFKSKEFFGCIDLLVFTSTMDAINELMELFPDIHIKPNNKNAILISSVYDTHTEVIKTIIDKLSDIVDIYM